MRLPARCRKGARIEMVPLIDVVFLLLVFFIYAFLSMIVPRGVRVSLPRVEGGTRTGREPVAVSIGRRGELFVDREPVGPGGLVGAVKARLEGVQDRWVVIQGDARAPLEAALEVLGRLRDGGIERATFRVGPEPAEPLEGAAPAGAM
jgi:biopolymer transport protein ExbD